MTSRYVPDDRLNLATYIEETEDDTCETANEEGGKRAGAGWKRALEEDEPSSPSQSSQSKNKRRKGQPVKKGRTEAADNLFLHIL